MLLALEVLAGCTHTCVPIPLLPLAGPPGDVAVAMLQAPLPFLQQLRQEHGSVVGLLLGGERVVLVAGVVCT